MKRTWFFGVATLCLGWGLQAFLLRVFPSGAATPHLLLLAVLALGARGNTNLAQSLGFFWGLGMDVFGVSLFGAQGLLLALTGYVTSRLSKQLNEEKLVTQEALALFGGLGLAAGVGLLESIFRTTPYPRLGSLWVFVFEIILNALIAPVVFLMVRFWWDFWVALEGGRPVDG